MVPDRIYTDVDVTDEDLHIYIEYARRRYVESNETMIFGCDAGGTDELRAVRNRKQGKIDGERTRLRGNEDGAFSILHISAVPGVPRFRQSRKRVHRRYIIPSCSPLLFHITLHVKHWDNRAYLARSSFLERDLLSHSRRRFRRNDNR